MRERSLKFASHREFYLTACAGPGSVRVAAFRAFDELAGRLARSGARPIRETVYGTLSSRAAILSARRAALGRHGLEETPAAYLEGKPVRGRGLAGVQIWAVRGGGEIGTVRADGVSGRLWEAPGFRLLHLCGLDGRSSKSETRARGAAAEAERMFLRARAALERWGFSYGDTARTWIYIARLLDWYDGFNRLRNKVYARPDFLGGLSRPFPASTGIQATGGRSECGMDLLAVKGPRARVRPVLKTSRQGPSFAYRSAFSRAAVASWGGRRTVLVSGTASIDPAGKTAHAGDPEAQCAATLLNLAALLSEQGGGLRDIVSATLFCKNRAVFDAYLRVERLLDLPGFPAVGVLADVCRKDLLVEIEATAVL